MQHMDRMLALVFCSCLVLLWWGAVTGQPRYDEPESVVFDYATDRYFVSNKGDGKIFVLNPDSSDSVYNHGLSSCRGLHITDNFLYGVGTEGIVKIDLDSGEQTDLIEIEGRSFLNDITSDTSGYLYVTDSSQGKIYKVRKSDYFYTDFATGLTGVNGILFVPQLNILYYCTGRDIKQVSLVDSVVTDVIRTFHGRLDGLAMDSLGYIYFSSWGSDGVFRYDPWFSLEEADTVSVGHTDPADICFNVRDNILAVPNYSANTVDFIPVPVFTSISQEVTRPNGYALWQNYPNPFNPETRIRFRLAEQGPVRIAVYNVHGQEVAILTDQAYPRGEYSITWNATGYSSGVYMVTLSSGSYLQTRKMVLMR